ncbi:ABC transporter substrate-binding protein [Desulfobacula toluolica]|uniref:Periplasmic binding protein n=1 Tax=Desulfobacula toluolica (strain DSM 7467 / Tol2) TaxID=651182 RepID=K0NQA2_DESTT|nr:ABC transporter substrate-binding protein [Desulfobacula toluolica]CCK82343.1 periplasmic binding protein [Desulfobacula toluolica Tol2]
MFKLNTPCLLFKLYVVVVMIFGFSEKVLCLEKDFTKIKDSRGIIVKVPKKINRVVTISDGMVEQVMTRLGVAEKIVGAGSECIPKKQWNSTYPALGKKKYTYKGGMHTATYLNPWFIDIPLITRYGAGINYEMLTALEPDIVIIRAGSCSFSGSKHVMEKSISLIESLGFPVVVLHGPDTYDDPDILTIFQEIKILGKVFDKIKTADNLINFLKKTLEFIKIRTKNIQESEKQKILLLGLSQTARSDGGAGHVKGADTIESYFMNKFVHAENVCKQKGAWNILNTEQILALDPDVIILITAWGYHPPQELYDAPYYQSLKYLRAVTNHNVASLPFSPCNCEKRLEFPIDVMIMAKTAYPLLFKDIDLASWLLNFYKNLYGIDSATAKGLRSCQWMDWTLDQEK